MQIATWNVNSLSVRLPQVLDWLAAHPVDVLCLQELKLTEDKFPFMELHAVGYEAVAFGQKTYNGVAILTRTAPTAVVRNIPGFEDEQARVIAATVETPQGPLRVLNGYFVNGQAPGTDKFAYKLRWLQALHDWVASELAAHPRLVLLGDFNVAPEDRDVWSIKAFGDSTHVTEPERRAIDALRDWGMVDAFRALYDDDRLYTYWDYRRGDFHQHRGMRIDLVLVTRPLADRVQWAVVDRNARKGQQPSDHAPVIVDLADA